MDTIKLLVGTIETTNDGRANDRTREVAFEGEELATVTLFGHGPDGRLTNTRGTTQTLYRAGDGRLVVAVHDWSNWEGEPEAYGVYEVTAGDLGPTGWYAELGAAAGMSRPLTLDEALALGAVAEEEASDG